jgi:hypothetical protein
LDDFSWLSFSFLLALFEFASKVLLSANQNNYFKQPILKLVYLRLVALA